MPKSAQSRVEEVINQFSVPQTARNIYGFIGPTKRGPINDPKDVITSWPQFERIFGGLVVGNDFPLLCKRALERGTSLRVCNVKHYTTITNAATLDAVLVVLNETARIELDGPLVAGQTMEATINTITKTLAFNSSSKNTLDLFAKKLMTELPAIVEKAYAVDGQTLIVVPKTAVTLSVASTPTGDQAPTATIIQDDIIGDGDQELFKIKPKEKGADYNNVIIDIRAAISGEADAFDIIITHALEGTTETYLGLKIPGKPSIADSKFLDKIKKNSYMVDIEYLNLSGATGEVLSPLPATYRFKSGTDGSALVANDYIGSSASKTGFQAFNQYDDMLAIMAPNVVDASVHFGGAAYVDSRQDAEYHLHLSNDLVTEDALITERDNLNIDSSYVRIFAGGIKAVDPITGADKDISEGGDVAGIIGYSAEKFGPWISASGKRRGLATNAKGVVNNFGGKNNIKNLDRLAARQINTMIVRDGQTMLWGNFTASKADNSLRWANVRSLLIAMKKDLGPFLDNYLEEPNDIPTWKSLYAEVRPYLEQLQAKRAIHSYSWQGDQDAKSMQELTVNTFQDVQDGKYLVKLYIKEIVSMQEIVVQITLDNSNISFEESISEVNQLQS